MYRQAFRQTARQFSRVAATATASRSYNKPLALAMPFLGYGIYKYNQQPILNDDEIAESDITYKPTLIGEEPTEEKAESGEEEKQEGDDAPQGAFNPDTGEINWDCPCLGGMAEGPCGEEFKAAFSCFVYSEAEPKGVDCIEKFSGMQDCFRKYPEVYSEQLRADDPLEADSGIKEEENTPQQLGSEMSQSQAESDRTLKQDPEVLPDDKYAHHDQTENKKAESWSKPDDSKNFGDDKKDTKESK